MRKTVLIALLLFLLCAKTAYAQEETSGTWRLFLPSVTAWPHEDVGEPVVNPTPEPCPEPCPEPAEGLVETPAQSFSINPADYPSYESQPEAGDSCDGADADDCKAKNIRSGYLVYLVDKSKPIYVIYNHSTNYASESYAQAGMVRISAYWHNYSKQVAGHTNCKNIAWKQLGDESFACTYTNTSKLDLRIRTVIVARMKNIVVQIRLNWLDAADMNINSDCTEHLFNLADQSYPDKVCPISSYSGANVAAASTTTQEVK